MKHSNKVLITVLSILIAGILLSLPISLLMSKEGKASTDEGTVNINETYTDDIGEDYIFVVLEDEDVPLAMAPVSASSHNSFFFIGLLSVAGLSAVVYTYWYLSIRRNIKRYSYLISDKELRGIVPRNSFVHPVTLSAAEREVQSAAAYRFF